MSTEHTQEPAETSGDQLTASEALFGFAGWVTSRQYPVIASARHDAGIWAELVGQFCAIHNLPLPRDGWEKRLNYPEQEITKEDVIGGRAP